MKTRAAVAFEAKKPLGMVELDLYAPECRQCKSCVSGKTNLCTAIRATQGKELKPDGTSRFSYKGQTAFELLHKGTSIRSVVVF